MSKWKEIKTYIESESGSLTSNEFNITQDQARLILDIKVNWYNTVCPRSSDPFYVATYYIKWGTASWTYSIIGQIEFMGHAGYPYIFNLI